MRRRGKQLLVLSLAGIILASSGCQKTPDSDIVVNKNEGVFEEKLKEKKKETEKKKVPKKQTDSFENDGKDVKISVDATISTVDEKMPAFRVRPHTITMDEIKHWADVLFEGKTAYEPKNVMTKKEVEERILMLKKEAGDKEKLIEEYGSESAAQKMIEYYDSQIKGYEKMHKAAPETYERKECDWKFHAYSYYDENSEINIDTKEYQNLEKTQRFEAEAEVNGYNALISVTNREQKDYRVHMLWFYYWNQGKDIKFPYKKITESEALSIAEEIMGKLQLNGWELYSATDDSADGECFYKLRYTPSFSKIPVIKSGGIDLHSENLFSASYDYSELEIEVRNGIVSAVCLSSPVDVVNEENDNVNTIEYEEAYKSFKTYMQTKYTRKSFALDDDPLLMNAKAEIKVTNIKQGMFRVKEKNNKDEYLMIPVWVFGGTLYLDGNKWSDMDFCMLNAVDGSVIDTSLGY